METVGGTVVGKYYADDGKRQYLLGSSATGIPQGTISSGGGTAGTNAWGTTHMTTATWYHLAYVYNDTDVRLYLNGLLDANATGPVNPLAFTAGIAAGTAKFIIGANDGTSIANYFDGLIDDVAIFNRALTAAEVLAIKNYGVTGEGYPSGTANGAKWFMDF